MLAALLLAIGCNTQAKKAAEEAAAKRAQAEEVDRRAKAVAGEMIQQAEQDAEKKRRAAAQQAITARTELRQRVIDHPDTFLEASNLEVVDKGNRHLSSVTLTNKSNFSMAAIRGTLDFHGGTDVHDGSEGVLAQVPIQLTGSIAPGASMVFTEQQHTLSGAAIRLTKAPSRTTFTVTGVGTVAPVDIDLSPAHSSADGGAIPQRAP